LRARDVATRIPWRDPKLVKLGADLALSAEVPTGPGASCGLPISPAGGWPKASTTSVRVVAETDGWTGLAERFEAGLLEDFAALVEQIELALQLLEDGTRSRLRTALVELDCLADILLYRRTKLVERATDGSSHHNHARTPTYPERMRLEGNFADRVTEATEAIGGAWFISLPAMLRRLRPTTFGSRTPTATAPITEASSTSPRYRRSRASFW